MNTEGLLPSVGLNADPAASISAPAFQNAAATQADEQGKAITRLSEGAMAIAHYQQQHVDDARTKEALNNGLEGANTIMLSQDGYLSKLGKDAVSDAQPAYEALKKNFTDIEGGLDNDVQKFMFRRTSQAYLQQFAGQIGRHSLEQSQQYDLNETVKRADLSKQTAIGYSGMFDAQSKDGQPNIFDTNVRVAVDNLDAAFQKRGIALDSAQAQEGRRDFLTDLYSKAIGQFVVAQRPDLAKAFLEKYAGQMAPGEVTRLGMELRTFSAEQTGIDTAMKYSASFKNPDFNIEDAIQKGWKEFGGGTGAFKSLEFQRFEGQLRSSYAAFWQGQERDAYKAMSPFNQQILQWRQSGHIPTDAEVTNNPAILAAVTSGNPALVAMARTSADQALTEYRRLRVEQADTLTQPVYDAIEKAEGVLGGRRLTLQQYQALPEVQAAMRASAQNPELGKILFQLERTVGSEANQQMREDRAELRYRQAEAKADARQKALDLDAQQQQTVAYYISNPRAAASLSQEQSLAVQASLGKHAATFARVRAAMTSPEAVGKLELDQGTFNSAFSAMGWTDKKKISEARILATSVLLSRQKDQGFAYNREEALHALASILPQVDVKSSSPGLFSSTFKESLGAVKDIRNIKVPTDDRAQILSDLKARGKANPTELEVQRAYVARLTQQTDDLFRRGVQ